MGDMSGGASPYGPFIGLNRMALANQAMLLANQQAQSQAAGQTALGNYIQQGGQMGFGLPGGSPGYDPYTPAPGQASQPLQITQRGVSGASSGFAGSPMPAEPQGPTLSAQPSVTVGGAPQPAAGALAASAYGPGNAQSEPAALTGNDAAKALADQPGPQGRQGGGPGGQTIPLDRILQGIVKANPKASPRDIYQAASLYLPYMTEQDNALLRQAMMQNQFNIAGMRVNQSDVNNARNNATRVLDTQKVVDQRVAAVAQRASDNKDALTLRQVQGIQRQMAAQEAIINQTWMIAQNDPDLALQQQQQAQAQLQQLEAQLKALESGPGPAPSPTPTPAPAPAPTGKKAYNRGNVGF